MVGGTTNPNLLTTRRPIGSTSHVNGQAIPVDGGRRRRMRANRFRFLLVMAGLDPAIHLLRKTLVKIDGYAGQARV
jgi:hypothetical protein